MVFFTLTSLLAASAAFAGVTALPTAEAPSDAIIARSGTQSGTGTNGGYYYSFYTDNNADVIYTNQNGGAYEVQWDGNGDFVAGKGWSTGSARCVPLCTGFARAMLIVS
jgi:endo-1,4-beta-xylanase